MPCAQGRSFSGPPTASCGPTGNEVVAFEVDDADADADADDGTGTGTGRAGGRHGPSAGRRRPG